MKDATQPWSILDRLKLEKMVLCTTGMRHSVFRYTQKDFVSRVVKSLLDGRGSMMLDGDYFMHKEIFDLAARKRGLVVKLWTRDGDHYASFGSKRFNEKLQYGEPPWPE